MGTPMRLITLDKNVLIVIMYIFMHIQSDFSILVGGYWRLLIDDVYIITIIIY